MPVFCAYCGKSFTRKEHLERHIPQREHLSSAPRARYFTNTLSPPDTNVKPHRCSSCQLSFARRQVSVRFMSMINMGR